MNSYQRYLGMVRGESVDIVPRIPILMHFAADHISAGYGDFCRDWCIKVEANRRLVEEFDFDQLDVMSDPWVEAADFEGQLTGDCHRRQGNMIDDGETIGGEGATCFP